jgi:hypothetical protein
MGVPCKCGRFLANAHATCGIKGEGYSGHVFVAEVRGDCKRCGPDVQAMRDGWHWSWDAWRWPPEMDCL